MKNAEAEFKTAKRTLEEVETQLAEKVGSTLNRYLSSILPWVSC